MKYIAQLAIEVGTIAAITAVALVLAVWLGGPISTLGKAAVIGALIGAWIHLAFELSGGNTYYCKAGAACSKLLL